MPGMTVLLIRSVRIPRARQCTLGLVVPATLLIIFVAALLTFSRFGEGPTDHGQPCPSALSGGILACF